MRILLAALAAMVVFCSLSARELFPGQYAQVDEQTRNWFRNQRVPGSTMLCCNEADGTYAEEDIRDGHYWTRFKIGYHQVEWMQVPDEVVIHEPNRNGSAVVWYLAHFANGNISSVTIRCFSPGGGV